MEHEDHAILQIAAAGEIITTLQSTEMTSGAFLRFEDRITRAAPGPPAHQRLESLQNALGAFLAVQACRLGYTGWPS